MNPKMTVKAAYKISKIRKGNTKIPGSVFSVDPRVCNVGSKLRSVKGSICEQCYAITIADRWPSAGKSWIVNLENWNHALATDPQSWIEATAFQINKISERKAKKNQYGAGYHRWFAAGDLPSLDHLRMIIKVAELTPNVQHWLPTREYKMIRQYINNLGFIPDNLTIRISAPMQDGQPPMNIKGVVYSTVTKRAKAIGFDCPASAGYTDGCEDCTACFDKSVEIVSYQWHK